MASQRWIPLESNPEVLNKYIETLGVLGKWQFVDIYGLDDEVLTMVSSPVAAVMLLYPLTDKAKAKDIGEKDKEALANTYFMQQIIDGACGTVALVHALANNQDKISFAGDKHFQEFLNQTKDQSPEERGKFLEKDKGMWVAHEELAQEGDTQAPSRDTSVMPHFVAFVHKDGNLYEMDGRKEAPMLHGKTSQDTLLQDTLKVVKKFLERDPDELRFNLMALAKDDQ